jgi:hypothetical protein
MHSESGMAIRYGDGWGIYSWHGTRVPEFVIERPSEITAKHVREEQNAEVRRVMIERMGWERFCSECEMRTIHSDTLSASFPTVPVSDLVADGQRFVYDYRSGVETVELLEAVGLLDFEDRPLKFVRLTDPSTGRTYIIRVAHDTIRAYQGVAASFGMTEDDYKHKHFHRHGDVLIRPIEKIDGLSIHS